MNNTDYILKLILKLRKETGASLMDCKRALLKSNKDYNKALNWLDKNNLIRPKKV